MKPENKVFFSEHGITSTSANYLANLAKEIIAQDKAELSAADFLTTHINIIGSGSAPMISSEGKDEDYVNDLNKKLLHCSAMHQFNAWMREAIKAKEDEENYWQNYGIITWAKEVEGIEMPQCSITKKPTIEEVVGDMNIKEREEYFALEATASVFGQFIHEDGAINKARKRLHKGMAKPTWTEGNGRDTIVYTNTASAKPELVDETFNKLQNYHRSIEQRLNSIKAKQKEELNKRITKWNQDRLSEQERIAKETDILQSKYRIYIQERLEEVRKLKIVIPERLKLTYDYLNSLGKEPEKQENPIL